MNGVDVFGAKDPAIKLFGKTILVPECHIPAKSDMGSQFPNKSDAMEVCCETTKMEAEDVPSEEESRDQDHTSEAKDGKKEGKQTTPDRDDNQTNAKVKNDPAETSSVDQEKLLKKPEKVLPCPRCNSLDTKFCYFNNYNLNQPRHFCKNCQRYWTAGGTMRNVPVGAGRRKNKHFTSQFRQILVSPDSANQQILSCGESQTNLRPVRSNGTVLKFGPEGHFCESMATVLHVTDQKSCASDSGLERENKGEPSSCASSITASSIQENQMPERVKQQGSEFPQPNAMQCYPVPPWVIPWNNQVWNSGASVVAARCSSELVSAPNGGDPSPNQWCSTPLLAVPGFCTPNIPLQFVPVWTVGTRHIPMAGPDGGRSLSSSTANCCSGNNSPNLGKHSRDGNSVDEDKSENCVLVPKTLRIDDPEEASKSSIWATLGLKGERKELEPKCSITGPFRSSAEHKGHPSGTSQVLEANPAALSRSHTFQESM